MRLNRNYVVKPPVRTGYSVVDMGTGMWASNAILAALLRRQMTGEGCCVEVSLAGLASVMRVQH